MVDARTIEESFRKCVRPIDFAQRYSYFKSRYNIKENKEILEVLQFIERKNLLGALYIFELKEKSVGEIYIDQFVERNKELITDKIRFNNEETAYFMQVAYLCFMNVSKERCLELCKDIFSTSIYNQIEPEVVEFENSEIVSKHYTDVFLSAVDEFDKDNIAWVEKYCQIVTSIFYARNEDLSFLRAIEFTLREKHLGYAINDTSAREYFDLLCKYGAYDSARFFLDNFDGSKMYLGMQPQDFIAMLYSLPDPGLLAFGKWYITIVLRQEYTYHDWLADVVKNNHDIECIKWIKLTEYYHRLKDSLDIDDINGFERLLEQASDFELFDMNKIKYMKQILKCSVFILNKLLLLSYKNVQGFLKMIENINLADYTRAKYLIKWKQFLEENVKSDYAEIKKKLFENYSFEDAIYIYMNSHLKCIINIEDFVKVCAEKNGEDVYELFKYYPLKGRISLGSKLGSIRDKIFITPTEVVSNVSFQDYLKECKFYGSFSKEAQKFKKRMIRSDEKWYSSKKEIAELMKDKDYCIFYLKTYKKNVGILATDLSLLYDNIKIQRMEERNNNYPTILINWLSEMQSSREYQEWDHNNDIYGVRHLENNSIRENIALEILNTILALQGNIPALEKFMHAITYVPLEEINEFRHIPNQKKLRFELSKGSYYETRRLIIDKANVIMKNECIPVKLRKDIYLNTCIRKYYDLKVACNYIGSKLYLATADEPFAMALRFEAQEPGLYYFSTKWKDNTLFSNQRFLYKGEGFDLTLNYIYLVTLKEYDMNEGCFILENIDIPKEQIYQWEKYLRRVMDIKKVTDLKDSAEMNKIKKDLETYQIKVTADNVEQFVHELNIIFKRQDYDIESAIKTLELIEKTNPFIKQDKDFSFLAEKFKQAYYGSYILFLKNYREKHNSSTRFCDLFFSSYLKLFISYDEFFNDITNNEEDRENILNYCKLLKRYI